VTTKRGRPCRVCQHPRVREIDAALRDRAKIAVLVGLYGIGEGNLRRHAKNHLQAAPAPAPAESLPSSEPSTVARLLQLRTMKVLRDAEASGEPRVQLAALRAARENLEQAVRLRAQEPPPYDPARDELLAALRDRLASTLRAYPEALDAVRADFATIAGEQ
jgi:hypothetical protein